MSGWACIARFGGIGDNLIAASPLRPLKRLGYRVEMLTDWKHGIVYQNNPFIDKLTVLPDKHIPSGEGWNKWFEARAKEYELFAHLSHSVEGRHALNVGSSGFWWPQRYRRSLCAGSYLETAHDIVGVAYDFGPLFFPTDEERESAEETKKRLGGKYIAWVIAGSRVDKVYPYSAMAIARIIRELRIPVMLIGGGSTQSEYAKSIGAHLPRQNGVSEGLHLALTPAEAEEGGERSWPERRSLTQAMYASAVVSPDTGTAWAVALEELPKIILVSHASAENITKHWRNTITLHADSKRVPCWPCHRLHDSVETCVPMRDNEKAAACMGDIQSELIVQSVAAALSGQQEALAKAWPRNVSFDA